MFAVQWNNTMNPYKASNHQDNRDLPANDSDKMLSQSWILINDDELNVE